MLWQSVAAFGWHRWGRASSSPEHCSWAQVRFSPPYHDLWCALLRARVDPCPLEQHGAVALAARGAPRSCMASMLAGRAPAPAAGSEPAGGSIFLHTAHWGASSEQAKHVLPGARCGDGAPTVLQQSITQTHNTFASEINHFMNYTKGNDQC